MPARASSGAWVPDRSTPAKRATLLVVGTSNRSGSSSPTFQRNRRQLVRSALLDRTASRPSEMGQDPAHRPGTHLTGWCCRWRRCWPWPNRVAGSPQICGRRPRLWLPITGTLVAVRRAPSACHRPSQRTPLEPRLAAARTLAPTQAQPGGHPSCAP